ncbi:hypothetical protein LTR53_003307 [Teratosphaeriaceae sp. CCFEE 6253]|nr:hypothetical protein LTR53_003307 [Teratosphaeriaceae sp. CCFEE 6253]
MRTAVRGFGSPVIPPLPGRFHALPLRQSLRRSYAVDARSEPAHTFAGYVTDPLDAPLRSAKSAALSAEPANGPAKQQPSDPMQEEKLAKFRTIFGSSRHTEPEERKRAIESRSELVAGVLVPPKPEEPENCCMSGCANCVWDLFRDDMEEWAAKTVEARAHTAEQRLRGQASGLMGPGAALPSHVATSMDDDGGGSDTAWSAGGGPDLFADIPVGIREFMKTEKKLKLKKQAEKAGGP